MNVDELKLSLSPASVTAGILEYSAVEELGMHEVDVY
jgi:hypothetical protein